MKKDNDENVKIIIKRIEDLLGLPCENLEDIQIGNYQTGQFYGYHTDSFDTKGYSYHRKLGFHQRLFTVMIYLNKPLKGGNTRFKYLDISIKPEVGKLLVFSNVIKGSNKINEKSIHSGLPVEEGEKWIMTFWFNSFTLKKKLKKILKFHKFMKWF